MKKIILASSSPRRKQLLKKFGLTFTVVSSNIEEIFNPRLKPRHQVEELASQKAEAVASEFSDAIIIGADTLVALEDEVLGKPKDKREAKRMLKKLQGRVHSIVTGFVLIDTDSGRKIIKSVETKVWFRKLSSREINAYLEREKPYDKAGAYAMQDLGAIFIEKIDGDYFSAVGLPLYALAKGLQKLGISVL
jgi:septum formation protein